MKIYLVTRSHAGDVNSMSSILKPYDENVIVQKITGNDYDDAFFVATDILSIIMLRGLKMVEKVADVTYLMKEFYGVANPNLLPEDKS